MALRDVGQYVLRREQLAVRVGYRDAVLRKDVRRLRSRFVRGHDRHVGLDRVLRHLGQAVPCIGHAEPDGLRNIEQFGTAFGRHVRLILEIVDRLRPRLGCRDRAANRRHRHPADTDHHVADALQGFLKDLDFRLRLLEPFDHVGAVRAKLYDELCNLQSVSPPLCLLSIAKKYALSFASSASEISRRGASGL